MKKYLSIILLVTSIVIVQSCREDFTTIPSTITDLRFSKDTVFLDTVFTNIGSATYNLKVYNKSDEDIHIPSIYLEDNNSGYRLNVDGRPGKSFSDVTILANDSIFVFIETTQDAQNNGDLLYVDRIIFDNGARQDDVDLVTLVKDAHFLYPAKDANGVIETIVFGVNGDGEEIRAEGFYLSGSETWTADKPYVIYGYCAVPENATLTIDPGAEIHFHDNSGLVIEEDATLKVNGELDNKVSFKGDKLGHEYENIPGQWSTIWLRAGSVDNEIHHSVIKNAITGILCDSIGSPTDPTLRISNTELYNFSNHGILGRETNIEGENVVLNNAGFAALACTVGGTYNFRHCTIANYWQGDRRDYPSLLINNFYSYQQDGSEIIETRPLHAANFNNCIIDGNNNIELIVDKLDLSGDIFNFRIKNSLIKFNDVSGQFDGIPEYDFDDPSLYPNKFLNGVVDFKNTDLNEMIIGDNSDANGWGDTFEASLAPFDILNMDRTSSPDAGAYQHITFPEE